MALPRDNDGCEVCDGSEVCCEGFVDGFVEGALDEGDSCDGCEAKTYMDVSISENCANVARPVAMRTFRRLRVLLFKLLALLELLLLHLAPELFLATLCLREELLSSHWLLGFGTSGSALSYTHRIKKW